MLIYIATYLTEQFTLKECVSVCVIVIVNINVIMWKYICALILLSACCSAGPVHHQVRQRELFPYDTI